MFFSFRFFSRAPAFPSMLPNSLTSSELFLSLQHYNSSFCSFIFFSRTNILVVCCPMNLVWWPSVISWTLKLIHTNWKYHAKIFLFSVLHPQGIRNPSIKMFKISKSQAHKRQSCFIFSLVSPLHIFCISLICQPRWKIAG